MPYIQAIAEILNQQPIRRSSDLVLGNWYAYTDSLRIVGKYEGSRVNRYSHLYDFTIDGEKNDHIFQDALIDVTNWVTDEYEEEEEEEDEEEEEEDPESEDEEQEDEEDSEDESWVFCC